jgi:hypothetical protein
MLELLIALAAIGAASPDGALQLHEGGFCAGISWVVPPKADHLSIENGPDFSVYRYDASQTDWWGIYAGNAAQVSNGEKRILFKRDGVTVSAVTMDGKPRGYLAVDSRGWQNHFFGSPFATDDSAMQFFKNVTFGPEAVAKCSKYRSQ